jgi:hypothetical protein
MSDLKIMGLTISVHWRSEAINAQSILPELAELLRRLDYLHCVPIESENAPLMHAVHLNGFYHMMTVIGATDRVMEILREKGVERPMRSCVEADYDSIGEAHNLTQLFHRLDKVEDYVREAVDALKKTRRFQMVPYLGTALKEIPLSLERALSDGRRAFSEKQF